MMGCIAVRRTRPAFAALLRGMAFPGMLGVLLLVLGSPLAAWAQFTTPMSFVPQSNGNFGGTIPIRVPPATGGLGPQVAISYSSHSPNGPLGVGFSLQGLSAITRCARTLAQDGVRGSVNYDLNDKFCLDGQRLVVTNGGTYGANGTVYGTELDSFMQVTSFGTTGNGPTYFTVQTKGGLTETFGNTATSGVVALGVSSIRVWALSQVTDSAGNYYTITYTDDTANGAYYPNTIAFTANGSSAAQNSIQFTYSGRIDVIRNWTNGALVAIADRLTVIAVMTGSQTVRTYTLAYDNGAAAGNSRLKSVTECSTGGTTCLPPITFAWGGGSASSQTGTFTATSWAIPGAPSCAPSTGTLSGGNFSGSGRTDLLCTTSVNSKIVLISAGNGTFTAAAAWPSASGGWCTPALTFLGDFNGDGLEDVACFSSGNIYVGLGTGGGSFGTATMWTPPASTHCSSTSATVLTGDFDGDGRTDVLCSLLAGSTYTSLVAFSQGNGSFTEASAGPWISWCGPGLLQVADINGDGKSDLVCLNTNTGQINAALSNGDGTFTTGTATYTCPGTWGSGARMILGDFNGDGKTDVLCSDTGGHESVAFSMGNGNFTAVVSSAFGGNGPWCASSGSTLSVGDFNGDGKTDMMCENNANYQETFAFSNGDGSFSGPTAAWNAGWCDPASDLVVGDVSGDGAADLVCVAGGTVYNALSIGAPDLIASVNNGLNATVNGVAAVVTASYLPLTNATIYTRDSGSNAAVYPTQDVAAPYYVVSSVSRANLVSGTQPATTYVYKGLKLDQTGRGSLGFRIVSSTDAQTSIVSSSIYQQTFPYVGLPASSQTTLAGSGNAGLLKSIANTYYCNNSSSCTVSPGTKYFVSPYQVVVSGWDLNAAALPTGTTTSTFDSYGNALTVVNATSDGYSTTTVNTYNPPNLTNWWVGQLIESQVTSVTP